MLFQKIFWELYKHNLYDLFFNQMLQYKVFPDAITINYQIKNILQCFAKVEEQIDSQTNQLRSNEVLSLLRPYLIEADMQVEQGKRKSQRIRVPVLLGLN